MRSFGPSDRLAERDPGPRRRREGAHQLLHVLLFSILAVVTGGNSYRSIETFITGAPPPAESPPSVYAGSARRPIPPFATSSRGSIRRPSSVRLPPPCRRSAGSAWPHAATAPSRSMEKACAKLRQAPDSAKPAQLLHAFDTSAGLVLAHVEIAEKSNEIPAAQQLLGELQASRTAPSRSMHCTAKKTFEAAAQAQVAIIQISDNQPTPCCKTPKPACASLPTSSDTRSPPRAIAMKPGP